MAQKLLTPVGSFNISLLKFNSYFTSTNVRFKVFGLFNAPVYKYICYTLQMSIFYIESVQKYYATKL